VKAFEHRTGLLDPFRLPRRPFIDAQLEKGMDAFRKRVIQALFRVDPLLSGLFSF